MKLTVLHWNLSPARMDLLKQAAAPGIRLRQVGPGEIREPMLRLLTANPTAPGLGLMPFREEMLLMAGFTDDGMDAFLQAMRFRGLSIPLKAVLTPVNSGWDSLTLHSRLLEEHRRMGGG